MKRLALKDFTKKHASATIVTDQLLGHVFVDCHDSDPAVILDDPTVAIAPSGGPSSNSGTGAIEEVQQ